MASPPSAYPKPFRSGEFSRFLRLWRNGRGGRCGGCFPAAAAFVLGTAQRLHPRSWLGILPSERSARQFFARLEVFAPGQASFFPPFETLPDDEFSPDPAIAGARLTVLTQLARGESRPVITDLTALTQAVPAPEVLTAASRRLRPGSRSGREELLSWLLQAGYEPAEPVTGRGEFARRGGIVDIFPVDSSRPVRLEFDGDEISSLREFSPATQRSTGLRKEVLLLPLLPRPRASSNLFDHMGKDWLLVWPEETDPAALRRTLGPVPDAPSLFFSPFSASAADHSALSLTFLSLDRFAYRPEEEGKKFPLLETVARWEQQGIETWLTVRNQGELARLREILADRGLESSEHLRLWEADLDQGFLWEGGRLALVPDCQVFARYRYLSRRRKVGGGEPVRRPADLRPGDYVVHLENGIGRYLGMTEMDDGTGVRPKLQLQYADEARLYLPPSQIRRLSRYMGIGGAPPKLDRLGSGRWKRARIAAEKAVARLAEELLSVQAARAVLPGRAFPPDGPWQAEFEASFPFEETPDQVATLAALKADMEASVPMDRLICGDVGYGKTEVAVRAAFKAVTAGGQVAVLVPTTVLAQQHYRTFRERMADYPIRVEMLSRFNSPARNREVLVAAAAGKVDIVIGTHRLLQKDVAFRRLGLVVIDEEQRFGVRHKERFKRMRALVDVLTLTATPIPRTLYLALTGAKELSSIVTPPSSRQAVRTRVAPYSEEMVRRAVSRELGREGQVFYLFNRVEGIERAAARLAALFPSARVGLAHGQLPEGELSLSMEAFARGEMDILVCTTIIESGLDIPNANTLIVERADRFGLADLYQLRGRVGRLDRRAYAYFLYPAHGSLSSVARRRLRALEEFSQLGSGFDLSLRDLEIRGAGNILGSEQHGHILAVGFDLYCRLLADSVGRLKGELPPRPPEVELDFETPGYLPDSYVPAERDRIEGYRRWAEISGPEQLRRWEEELVDRYGPIPPEVAALAAETRLRLAAGAAGIELIGRHEASFVLYRDAKLVEVLRPPALQAESEILEWLADRLDIK